MFTLINYNTIKEIIAASLIAGVLMLSGFVFIEPAISLAVEDQVVINQAVTSGITISSPSDIKQ